MESAGDVMSLFMSRLREREWRRQQNTDKEDLALISDVVGGDGDVTAVKV
jgi:hypothetical protein